MARPGPSGRVAARCTDALHEVTSADTADTDANARTPDPGTPGRPHPGIGQRMRWTPARTPDGHPDTGHRTRVRVDATEYLDRPPRHDGTGQTSWTTTTTRLHTGPPNRGPVDGAWAPGNDEGSATVRYLPARDYLQHYQVPARSLRRPSRALAHCSPRKISGRG